MSSYICPICSRTFFSRIGYSQHMNSCVKSVDFDDDSQIPNTFSDKRSYIKDFKIIQDSRSSNENTVNLFFRTSINKSLSSTKISITVLSLENNRKILQKILIKLLHQMKIFAIF